MNKIYVENKKSLSVYFDLLLEAWDLYSEYEDLAKILLNTKIDKEEYRKLLFCSKKLDTILNDLDNIKIHAQKNTSEFSNISLLN